MAKKKSETESKKPKKPAKKSAAKVKPVPRGCEGVIPMLVVSDAKSALAFYQKAFGAEVHVRMPAPDGKRLMHAEMTIGKQHVYVSDEFPEWGNALRNPAVLKGTPVTLHQYVENCDKAIARAQKAGATVTMPAADMFWGDRFGKVLDPFGHEWSFASRIAKLSPKQMQAACDAAMAQPAS